MNDNHLVVRHRKYPTVDTAADMELIELFRVANDMESEIYLFTKLASGTFCEREKKTMLTLLEQSKRCTIIMENTLTDLRLLESLNQCFSTIL